MPELRLNVITKDWVIIARERAQRPDQFAGPKKKSIAHPDHVATCPFCPGNEEHTEKEISRLADDSGWKVRVFPNKYPALSSSGSKLRTHNGLRIAMNGVGLHEVIVDHRIHSRIMALAPLSEVKDILTMYRVRYRECRDDERLEAIMIYKNHGEAAGSSVIHPHSQLAATPVVPFQQRMRLEEAIRFYDQTGTCLFCSVLKDEIEDGSRIIYSTDHFVAFHPYAALSPFHTWVFPHRHSPSFELMNDQELHDLASVLQTVLGKLYRGLNDPPFNYTIRSIPSRDRNMEYYHWYLSVIPRVTKAAGFEMGSGMYINPSLPEESAAFLRAIYVDDLT